MSNPTPPPVVNASWNGATADWNTPSDWLDDIVPNNANTDVTLGGSGAYTVTIGQGESFSVGTVLLDDPAAIFSIAGTLATAALTVDAGTLALSPGATIYGSTQGGGAGSALELMAGAGPGVLNALGTKFTNFATVTVESGATWTVDALASALSGVAITGSGGSNELVITSSGAADLSQVGGFPTIDLAAGNNTVTLADATLSGGAVIIRAGGFGNNSVGASGDTAASTGKTLTYVAGTGTDSFTGGFENDVVKVSAVAVGGDTLTGGSGTNTLVLTSAGTANLDGVSNFQTIDLAAGGNTVTLGNGNIAVFTGAGGTDLLYFGAASGPTSDLMTIGSGAQATLFDQSTGSAGLNIDTVMGFSEASGDRISFDGSSSPSAVASVIAHTTQDSAGNVQIHIANSVITLAGVHNITASFFA